MNVLRTLQDYYRLPEEFLGNVALTTPTAESAEGFFVFGAKNTCFGHCSSGVAGEFERAANCDALVSVQKTGKVSRLPFDLNEVIDNLRMERYRRKTSGLTAITESAPIRKAYYLMRDGLPDGLRRRMQRLYLRNWKQIPFPSWPVDVTVDNLHQETLRLILETSGVDRVPFIWFWPEGAPNCVIMTHDVETQIGRDTTFDLIDLNDKHRIPAAFQVIPEGRYTVPEEYVRGIRERGCEFNIHDFNHDGNLYAERTEFERRAAAINSYARRYQARGFRAGAMYRNQDWYDLFDFSYDMSVPNVAHLEAMRGGCCTVMPYFIGKILELPLTTTEDYSLFHMLNDWSIDLWKRQLGLIRGRNGLMSFIAHPDYLLEQKTRRVYETLLGYLREMIDREGMWAALPGDVDRWWRARHQMRLVRKGPGWAIEGVGSERAKIAYARLVDDRVVYEPDKQITQQSAVS